MQHLRIFVLLLFLIIQSRIAQATSVDTYAVFTQYDPFDSRQSSGIGLTASGLTAVIPPSSTPIPMYVAAARPGSKHFGKLYYADLKKDDARLKCFLYVIDTGPLQLSSSHIDIAVNGRQIKRVKPFMSWKGSLSYFKLREVDSFLKKGKGYSTLPSPRSLQKKINQGIYNYVVR